MALSLSNLQQQGRLKTIDVSVFYFVKWSLLKSRFRNLHYEHIFLQLFQKAVFIKNNLLSKSFYCRVSSKHFVVTVRIMICFEYSIGSGPNWYQIGNKACYIPKVSKFYVEKNVFVYTLENFSFGIYMCILHTRT